MPLIGNRRAAGVFGRSLYGARSGIPAGPSSIYVPGARAAAAKANRLSLPGSVASPYRPGGSVVRGRASSGGGRRAFDNSVRRVARQTNARGPMGAAASAWPRSPGPPPKSPSLFARHGKMIAAGVVAAGIVGGVSNRSGRGLDKVKGRPTGIFRY